jgi:hypothetical protein
MAWAKAKTAIVGGGLALLVVGTLAVVEMQQDGREFMGTLTVVFPLAPSGPKTNTYAVNLLLKPPYWELSLTSSSRNHKVFGSPKQTFEVNLYDNPPTGPLNTAEVTIFPGSRPLADREAEHVWLALLSQKTFIGRLPPLNDPGLGMVEPSSITGIHGMMQDVSPRHLQWKNAFPNGRSIRIEGEFKWLKDTNTLDGLTIPTTSQMMMYLVDPDENRKLVSFSELVIDTVGHSRIEPIRIPRLHGRNVVYDYRLYDCSINGWSAKFKQYDVLDGKGLEQGPSILERLAARVRNK